MADSIKMDDVAIETDNHLNERRQLVLGQHLVRIGVMGTVARMAGADGRLLGRGTRVVCRTPRGLEIGEVLTAVEQTADDDAPPLGSVLRRLSVEDELLVARLERNKDEAFAACQEQLAARGIPAVLMDVELLFDGRSLIFYFLGDTTPEIDALTAELARVYDAEVQFTQFAETLTHGCGPGCGTDEAAGQGCGSGGCSTCAVATACKK